NPEHPMPVSSAVVKLRDAQRLYVARTYAYVADGADGLAIINIENPEHPKLWKMYNADGALNDTRAVQIGSVNASMFALVADGKNGMRVLQMISPDNVPEHMGFSPQPNPKLIATFPTHGPAVAISRGLDRDRVVDETGNQTVVFGRRGARPFHLEEMEAFYRHFAETYPTNFQARRSGEMYQVEDTVVHSGQLETRTGTKLNPAQPFKAPPEMSPAQPVTKRLLRRS